MRQEALPGNERYQFLTSKVRGAGAEELKGMVAKKIDSQYTGGPVRKRCASGSRLGNLSWLCLKLIYGFLDVISCRSNRIPTTYDYPIGKVAGFHLKLRRNDHIKTVIALLQCFLQDRDCCLVVA